jgi:hypothetical protein
MSKRTRLTAREFLTVPTMRKQRHLIEGARVHLIERETAPQQRPVSDQKTRQSDE